MRSELFVDMDSTADIEQIVKDISNEYYLRGIEITQYREEITQTDAVRITKRINGSRYAGEVSISDELWMKDGIDIISQQIEQLVRNIQEKMIAEQGRSYEYRGRGIQCSVDSEYALARCDECNYIYEFGNLPVSVMERHGEKEIHSTLEKWRREKLWMYMVEKLDRNCPCARQRRSRASQQ